MRALALALLAAAAQPEVPPLTGRVVDLADVVSPAAEAALDVRLAAHEDSTLNQVVVLTVPSLDGAAVETFATDVFRSWGLGQADRDNGVLLLIAVEDRELRIEVGYGLEGDLTDATAGSIIRSEIVPRFREGDYEGGVLGGVEAILDAIDGAYTPRPVGLAGGGGAVGDDSFVDRLVFALMFGGVPFLFLALFVVSGVVAGRHPVAVGCGALFPGLFVAVAVGVLFESLWTFVLALVAVPLLTVLLSRSAAADAGLAERRAGLRGRLGAWLEHQVARQTAFAEARRRGDRTVVVAGRTYRVPPASSSGGGGWSGSSGASSSSSFSGGGGSSGGGGASGSW